MGFGGAALKFGQTGLRVVQLLASIVVLGIYSYFLAILADHSLPISNAKRAVEGMSGAAVLYLAFAILLTLCLGGKTFFAFLAVVLDVCFIGCFAAIAYFNRHVTGSCTVGTVDTPLGTGNANSKSTGYGADGFGFGSGENVTYFPNLSRACQLEKAVFACAIINIALFIITAILQIALARHHKREKRFGPGPSNGYTAGSGRRPFWKRNKRTAVAPGATTDPEMGTAHGGVRPSGDTAYTETTAHGDEHTHNKYTAHTQY